MVDIQEKERIVGPNYPHKTERFDALIIYSIFFTRKEDDVFLGVSQMGGGEPELARKVLEKHLR